MLNAEYTKAYVFYNQSRVGPHGEVEGLLLAWTENHGAASTSSLVTNASIPPMLRL